MQKTKIAPFTVSFENSEEFHLLKREVFGGGVYYFETENPFPRIIDAGAHIGLSTLYFKKLYPGSHIIAIEPNPRVLPILEENIWQNALDNVEVIAAALSDQVGQRTLYIDSSPEEWWSTASFSPGAWNKEQESQAIMVPTVPLRQFLEQPVDFLKLDVEGAEQFILNHSKNYLHNIKHMVIEFHPTADQKKEDLLKLLTDHHFTVKLWKHSKEITLHQAKGLFYIEAKSTQLK